MRPWLLPLAAALTLCACTPFPLSFADDGRRGGYRLTGKGAGVGPLFLGGSGDEPPALLQRYRDLAGGLAARIVVCAFAGGGATGERYVRAFQDLGVADVVMIGQDRADGSDVGPLARADGVYVIGGYTEDGTKKALRYQASLEAAWRAGAAVGGHSAGAMVWGDRVITAGESRQAVAKGLDADGGGLSVTAGLGLLPGVIVDPHFSERGRFGRLWTASGALGRLGIGVDEDTAAIVTRDGRLTVAGLGSVTLIRPQPELGAEARVAVFGDGRGCDLREWGVTGYP